MAVRSGARRNAASTLVRTLLAMALLAVAACGGGGSSESAVETSEPGLLVEAGGESIPPECLESDEAFDDCYDDGLIPDECFDVDGYFIDECYPTEDGGAGASGPTEAPGPAAVTSGFDPAVDAFSFANYGDDLDATDLTPAEMQRMFGDGVCANLVGGCTLSPPARHWMENVNSYMAAGRCEGMAVLSSLFYFGYLEPGAFGADAASELDIVGNEALQREIAYWWATQMTDPATSQLVNGSPSEVLDALIETFSEGEGAEESWTIGIFKRDGTGGHAVTPYAVEDVGDGTYHVFVYDNNYASEGRILTIDRDADTWQYKASTNPSVEADLYEGDATTDTLSIHPTSLRLVQQSAAFEGAGEIMGFASAVGGGAGGVEVWLEGDANLLITALDGRRVGWLADGSFVNEIDGATATNLRFAVDVWDIDQEPIYVLPSDIGDFAITIDGSQLDEQTTSSVTVIGSDFYMVVEDVVLDPGQSDLINFSVVDGDYFALNYESDYSDSPDIWFGVSTDEADYEFIVRGSDIEPGGSFNVILDFPNGDFIINTSDQTEFGLYELWIARVDDQGEYVFVNDETELLPDDTMYVNFFEWEGDDSPMYLDFDFGSDGTIDDTLVLENLGGLYTDMIEQ
jgi:hypothetical protein